MAGRWSWDNANRNHVIFNKLSKMNPCVEPARNNVDGAVVGGDVEYDVRVIACKLSQFRCEHSHRSKPRHMQAHATRRSVAESGNLLQNFANIGQGWAQACKELFSCMGRCDAPTFRERFFRLVHWHPAYRSALSGA
jgi:hypothetical protein